jgi:signal transduction histidine kinase
LSALRRRHPVIADVAPVLVILALSVPHAFRELRHAPTSAVFDVLLALPLLWRRRNAVAVFGVIAAVALVQWIVDVRATGDLALLVALYSVAVAEPARVALGAAAVLEVGVVLASLRWGTHDEPRSIIALTAMLTAAGLLGRSTRSRRMLLASLEERAARLERERDQQGRLSAAAERSRIAREMHDIVAHNLSVMIALADGAAYRVHDDPDRAEDAMLTASRTGRQALTEMRRLLGVLREDDGARQDRAPQPGIGQIDALVEQVRTAGLPVTYEVSGRPEPGLPAGLQLAVFRIVQEALTNTLKHAGAGATARVAFAHRDGALAVTVSDTGEGAGPPGVDGAGLRGMRERAAVYDGAVAAGPAPGGGWVVRLEVPVAVAAAEPVAR